MKYKVGDKVRVKRTLSVASGYGGVLVNTDMAQRGGEIVTITKIYDNGYNISGDYWYWNDEMLEPADNIVRMADGTIIGDFSTGGGLVTIHDVGTHELWTTPFIIPKDRLDALVDAWAKLGCTTFNLMSDEAKEVIKKTEEKKMPTKFTFYVKEGTRPDKKCNGLIPTITTTVVDASGKKATVTCDKADYSERQGVLEAIAQMACGGNFDKEYDKAVKKNKLIELHDRTCTYCGKVFDTVEERKAEEAWHVERKKARRERYLLRKRANQKMAKEMIKEDK